MAEKASGFFKLTKGKVAVITAVLSVAVAFSTKDYIWGKFHWNTLQTAFPNFEVLEVKRTVDLSQWTPTVSKNSTDLTGKAIFTDWFTVRKIREEGNEFCELATSSGSDPKFTSQTHAVIQKPIDLKLVWWGIIKNQDLAILDVSKETINKPFQANFESVRYQGFTDTIVNWCSISIFHATEKVEFSVKFPKNKMGSRFRFSSSFFYNRDDFHVVESSSANYKVDSNAITWRIDNPIIGKAYRIDWDW